MHYQNKVSTVIVCFIFLLWQWNSEKYLSVAHINLHDIYLKYKMHKKGLQLCCIATLLLHHFFWRPMNTLPSSAAFVVRSSNNNGKYMTNLLLISMYGTFYSVYISHPNCLEKYDSVCAFHTLLKENSMCTPYLC